MIDCRYLATLFSPPAWNKVLFHFYMQPVACTIKTAAIIVAIIYCSPLQDGCAAHFLRLRCLTKWNEMNEKVTIHQRNVVPWRWESAACPLVPQLDPENTGFIAVENFTSLVEHHELQLDPSKLDMLLALVQSNEEGQVCYQELIELVSANNTHTQRGQRNKYILHLLMKRRDFHQVPAGVSTHLPIYAGFQKGYRIDWGRSSVPKLTAAWRSVSWKRRINLSFFFFFFGLCVCKSTHLPQRTALAKKAKAKEEAFSATVTGQPILIHEISYKMNGVGEN